MMWHEVHLKSYPTGSRVICDPPVMDTDEDFVVLVNDLRVTDDWLQLDNWEYGGSEQRDTVFRSYRKGSVNLIVTQNAEFYKGFVRATNIAKKLNLRKKEDRIALFDAILYPEEV